MIDLTSGGRYGLAAWDMAAGESREIEHIQTRERDYRQDRDRLIAEEQRRQATLYPHSSPKPDPLGGGDPYRDADGR